MAIFLAANIWAAKAQSYGSLMGSRFIGGFSGGVIEALGPFIVSETFPEHQLARAMVVYVGFLAAGSAIGPIWAGGIASSLHSWRWFFGTSSIATAINFISCILMLPETTHIAEDYSMETPGASLDTKTEGQIDVGCVENITGENVDESERGQSLTNLWIERSFFLRNNYVKPKQGPFRSFIQPFPLILAPPVLITTLVFGLTIGWTALMSIVTSNIYQMPPMLWGPRQIGFMNFGPLIGLLVGLPLGGVLADLLSNMAGKRSNGEHDPRRRLPAVILGALISPVGCIVIGFSFQNHFHWIATAIGWAMLAFGLTASANVLLTYSVDCFRTRAGHVGVLVNVVKNSLAFGVSFASMDWYFKAGPAAQFGTMAGLLWAAYLLIIPLYFYSHAMVKFSARFV
jgi:MFS family permease